MPRGKRIYSDRSRRALGRLLQKAQSGDETAFEELYRRTAQAQYFFIVSKVGAEHATDVLQEAYLIAWKNLASIRPNSFLGYLSATTRNLCRQQAERQAKAGRITALDDIAETNTADEDTSGNATSLDDRTSTSGFLGDPSSEVAARDEAERLASLLRTELTDGEREAILLRFYYRRKIDDIAGILGVSRNTVKRTVARALEKLRRKLGISPIGALFGPLLEEAVGRGAQPPLSLPSLCEGKDGINHGETADSPAPMRSVLTVAMAVVVLIGIGWGLFSSENSPKPEGPEASYVQPEEATALTDTTGPTLQSVATDDMSTVVHLSDETGVSSITCIDESGNSYAPASHENLERRHSATKQESLWVFNLPSGTYEIEAIDPIGNASHGEIEVDLGPDSLTPHQQAY
ncbi:MAG: sigma-70 family RNA polymerase sigma factor [Adlercreutzia sp.]|nr:sigma-70 family RNA polymerase sigma factor [Adlercreutzia sp.]